MPEDLAPSRAVRADEEAHVLDDAEHGDVHLAEHGDRLDRVGVGDVLGRGDDDRPRQAHLLGERQLGVPRSGWQIDQDFPQFLPLPKTVSRRTQLGDSIMTAIVLAGTDEGGLFRDLERLRLQECERVMALKTELTKCGARLIEEGQTLRVFPSTLHGAEIETYNDHRMAMCFGTLGLKVPGIKIKNPACVKKTFPNFFQKLSAAPPAGLGAPILNAVTGRELELDELIAE